MYRKVWLLLLFFLSFGLILAEPSQGGIAQNSLKLEPSYCPAADRDVPRNIKDSNMCADQHLETCYQHLRQLIGSCHGSSSEGTEDDGKPEEKAQDNGIISYIFMVFDVLNYLINMLGAFLKGFAIFIFFLHELLRHLVAQISQFISTLSLVLTWIFWFVQIIVSPIFSAVLIVARVLFFLWGV